MMDNKINARVLARFAVLLAIEALFCFTPLGSIPALGPIVMTLAMIPVILTGQLMGPGAGSLMGAFAGAMGMLLREYRTYVNIISGAVVVLLGLNFLGIFKFNFASPFSKMAEYWRLVIGSGKKFLIIANYTNTILTGFIHYFRAGLVWTGYNRVDWFLDTKRQPTMAAGFWYTNLPRKNRYNIKRIVKLKDIPDNCKYIDDSGTLCVDYCWIPSDYKKPFAVSAYPMLKGILELGYEVVSDKQYENLFKFSYYYYFKCVMPELLVDAADEFENRINFNDENDLLSNLCYDHMYQTIDNRQEIDFEEHYTIDNA
jgi:thiamine transporter ThiT